MQLISSIVNSASEFIVLLSKNAEVIIFTAVQYLLIAVPLYLLFYNWNKKKYWHLKIQQRYSENKQIIRDILYSISTIIVFGVVIILLLHASKHGYTLVYKPFNKYGYTWYFISILLMVIVHDAYFYWTHRLLHWKPLFKLVHITHHLSRNPTPFSAYAFHPLEALINVGIVPLVAFTIPAHVSAIVIFTIYQLLINVLGHLGFELLPKEFAHNKLTKWHNTFTHHNLHHQFIKYNYGLYLNFWDRIMKTNHPHYEDHFDKVVERKGNSEIVLSREINQQTNEVPKPTMTLLQTLPDNIKL